MPQRNVHEDGQGRKVSSGEVPGPPPGGGPLMDNPHLESNEGRYLMDPSPGSCRLSIDPGGWGRGTP